MKQAKLILNGIHVLLLMLGMVNVESAMAGATIQQDAYTQSIAFERQGKLDDAIRVLIPAHQASPTYQTTVRLAWLYYQMDRYSDSLRLYQEAKRYFPLSEDANLGIILSVMGMDKWQQAWTLTNTFLKTYPNNEGANRYMALIEYQLGHFEAAEKRYRRALEQNPTDGEMHLGLGLTLARQNRIAEASLHCKKAKQILPNDDRVRYCEGTVESQWQFQPQLFFLAGGYSDPWDKSTFMSGMFMLDIKSPSPWGGVFDYTYSWSMLPYQVDNFVQHAPGGAVYFSTQYSFLWLRYNALVGNDPYQGTGHIVALTARRAITSSRRVSIGIAASCGFYNGFQTLQSAPQIGFQPTKWFAVDASAMLQTQLGQLTYAGDVSTKTDPVYRWSGEINLKLYAASSLLSIGGFLGNRWFTVENNGLLVWNSDEELKWGIRLNGTLLQNKVISPTMGVRLDYADTQFGISHRFIVYGFLAGLIGTF